MWFLKWTSGKSGHDSDEHTHLRELPRLTSTHQQLEARELAIIAWEEAYKSPSAIQELYRDPQLVWQEPLVK